MLKTFVPTARMLMFPFREALGSVDLPGFQSEHRQEQTGRTRPQAAAAGEYRRPWSSMINLLLPHLLMIPHS